VKESSRQGDFQDLERVEDATQRLADGGSSDSRKLSTVVPGLISECQMSKCQTSKKIIGAAVYRKFELEAPAAEEMLDRVVCSREQFSFQM